MEERPEQPLFFRAAVARRDDLCDHAAYLFV
jgi:hypothetical protein